MFVGDICGKAESAINFYSSVFGGAQVGDIRRHDPGGSEREGTIKFATFTLDGVEFAAMDSAGPHAFTFNEAISFMVHCETQKEIDDCWGKLSARPEAEQCGWLKDKFGLSWQIIPSALGQMLTDSKSGDSGAAMQAMLKMKKLDIAQLQHAYRGR